MDQQGFSRIADGNVLRFAVHTDADGLIGIGILIHIDMADTVGMPEHRDPAVVHNVAHERIAAAGDDEVNQFILLQHGGDILPGFQQLGTVRRQAAGFKRLPHDPAQDLVGAECFAPALQQDGIAAFDAKGSDLDERIRAAFENDADHADRADDAVKVQAFRDLGGNRRGTDRIRQENQGMQSVAYLFQLVRSELQAVQKGSRKAFLLRTAEILPVGGKDFFGRGIKKIRHPGKHIIPPGKRGNRQIKVSIPRAG